MLVSEAVLERKSIRSFTNQEVSNELIEKLLTLSSRAASGGNLQPWKIYVINNSAMNNFLEFQGNWTKPELPAYDIKKYSHSTPDFIVNPCFESFLICFFNITLGEASTGLPFIQRSEASHPTSLFQGN